MLHPYTTLPGFTLSTYTFQISLGVLLSLGIWLVLNRPAARPGQLIDLWIGGMIGSLLLARAGFVILHFDYFAGHLPETLRLNAGGLDWHGAVMGGLSGMALVSRWRRIPPAPLLDSLALILPLMMLAAWRGCEATGCAYGAEISRMTAYPGWLVSEASDIYGLIAPRYNTHLIGMLLALTLWIMAALFYGRNAFSGRRFGLMLILMSSSMFLLTFLRGDVMYRLAGLRLDQWFDLLMVLTGMILVTRTHPPLQKTGYDNDNLKTTVRTES